MDANHKCVGTNFWTAFRPNSVLAFWQTALGIPQRIFRDREGTARTPGHSHKRAGLQGEANRAASYPRHLATLALVFLLGAGFVWGSITASISGTVTDPTGAVIPGASVTAHNTETGIDNSTQTNTRGFYSFPALPAGKYEVSIKANGFQEYRETGLVLDVNTALRVDAALRVGAVSQYVEVSATAVHVETSNTQMGEVIGGTKITTIPLNGRAYTDLLALQPGVAPASSGEGGGISVSGNLNPGSLSISGQRETANGFMVNGGSAEEKLNMAAGIVPNLDSIAEFRILTNNADAEYGNYAGGLINVITKSGTNQYHGSAFEFMRNPHLDARNFYSPERGVLHQNQFGGTAGGPIRHDKVFFFSDYQGTRMVQGVDTGLISVPSTADKTGNLADVADQLTGTVNGGFWANNLSQRLGYAVTSGEPYYASGCASRAQCVFPNAVIPQSAFTAPTKALMKYITDPNSGPYFTTSAYKETLSDNKGSARLDVNTRLGMLSGYYFLDDYVHINPYGGASLPGFSSSENGRAQMINLGITKSFGPNSVNELRLVYMRDINFAGFPVGGLGVSLASQGFTGIYPSAPQQQGVEAVGFNNFSIGAANGITRFFDNTYHITDNFSKVIGTHTLKFGGAFSYDQVTENAAIGLNGMFFFDGVETGNDFADFLIGAPAEYAQGFQAPMYGRSRYYALYGQDSWRATSNLTLNVGLRWEVSTPWWSSNNQIEGLVPGVQSKVFPGAPTGWVFPGDPGVPPTLAPTRYNNFAPRIGLAYSPPAQSGFFGKLLGGPGKTSIRAAFGVYFTALEEKIGTQEIGDAPYGYWWDSPAPPMFATPFVDRSSGQDRGQRFPAPIPPLHVGPNNPDNSIDWSQFEPLSSSPAFFHDNRLPYAEHYNFSFERQFGTATLVSLSYVGTQGHRLISTVDANPGNPALCLGLSQPSQVMPGTATCGPYGENGTYYPITGGVITTTRHAFSDAFGDDGWFATMANSNYNAFEASVRHTVGRLEFLMGYTWSKSLDNASGSGNGNVGDNINPVNYKITKALSAFDLSHNFVVSYSYRVPFDRLWHANQLTNGWAISGITRFSTGFPVYLTEGDDNSLLGTFSTGQGNAVDEPNRLPGPLNITDPRKGDSATGTNPYFNPSLFTKEAIGQLGNANRRFFPGPGFNTWDLSLTKELRLTESKNLQFRAELFNAFNHAQFSNPTGSITSSTFGFVGSARDPRIGQVAIKFLF